MRNRLTRIALAVSGIVVSSLPGTGAFAQEVQPPAQVPAVPSPANVTKSNAAGVQFLSKRYKVSAQEAEERLAFQNELSALATRYAEENPDQFGGIFVDHQPTYKVVILFKDAETRNAIREGVTPQLRRFVQLQKAKRSQKETREITDTLAGTLSASGVRSIVSFNHRNEKFVVTVADQAAAKLVSTLVSADLAPDVLTKVGSLPQDVQSGYVSGDYTYGGWTLYGSTNAPNCTFGYVVRLSDARSGLTTASHCSAVNPKLYVNGHYVTLATAAVTNNSGRYDFKVHPTGSLSVSGYVAYTNNQPIRGYESIVNSAYGYPNNGYFGVQDGLYRVANNLGDVMCKSGQRTGLSCGEVVDNYATYTTVDGVTRSGMVALGYSYERVIGYQGDSGGPVFTSPASDGTIKPAGLVSSANGPSSGPCDTNLRDDCLLYYMPIDRINDSQPMQIKTMTGTLNP
jgi:hypothetical protein